MKSGSKDKKNVFRQFRYSIRYKVWNIRLLSSLKIIWCIKIIICSKKHAPNHAPRDEKMVSHRKTRLVAYYSDAYESFIISRVVYIAKVSHMSEYMILDPRVLSHIHYFMSHLNCKYYCLNKLQDIISSCYKFVQQNTPKKSTHYSHLFFHHCMYATCLYDMHI